MPEHRVVRHSSCSLVKTGSLALDRHERQRTLWEVWETRRRGGGVFHTFHSVRERSLALVGLAQLQRADQALLS